MEIQSSPEGGLTVSSEGETACVIALGHLDGPVTIAAPATTEGSTSVTVVGTDDSDALTVSASEIETASPEVIYFAAPVATLAVEAGGGDDQVTVADQATSTAAVTVDLGTGANTVEIQSSPEGGLTVSSEGESDSYVINMGDLNRPVNIDGGAQSTEVTINAPPGDNELILTEGQLTSRRGVDQSQSDLTGHGTHGRRQRGKQPADRRGRPTAVTDGG